MCTSVKQAGRIISVGQAALIIDYYNQQRPAILGINTLSGFNLYNARDDKLNYWQNQGLLRGLMLVETFYDRGFGFDVNHHAFYLGILHGTTQFAIITTASRGPVANIHHRMPLLVGDPEAWMQGTLVPPTEPILAI